MAVLDVEKNISSPSGASCAQDPITSWILKQCKDHLLPTITEFVNHSLSSGKFPKSITNAFVKPLIKKSSLETSEYNNYRPLSNLGFVSKVIDMVVANQLHLYLCADNVDDEIHPAYIMNHSPETTLLKVISDIHSCFDQDQDVIPMFLDLSVAFNNMDYDSLVGRFISRLDIKGVVFLWLNSYLLTRTQTATIMGLMYVLVELLFGVPQGSVLALCYLFRRYCH